MKKFKHLIPAIAFIAINTSQAATYNWFVGDDNTHRVLFDSLNSGDIGTCWGTWVYIGSSGASTWDYAEYFSDTSKYNVMSGSKEQPLTSGKKGLLQDVPFNVPNLGTGTTASYALLLTIVVEGVTWYNISSDTTVITGPTSDMDTTVDAYFHFGSYASGAINKTWGSMADGAEFATEEEAWAAAYLEGNTTAGWHTFSVTEIKPPTPVPEPATAGLALAGLALLFRRKRK